MTYRDHSRAVAAALAGVASLAHELVGWPYHRDLDLTGFIDGTENPTIVESAAVAIVPEGQHGEGSSILLLQQWEHDVMTWEALPVVAQEDVIGRRKLDSAELSPRPPSSHVARTDQDTFGKIFRRNIPYGTLAHQGTIFVGFSAAVGRRRDAPQHGRAAHRSVRSAARHRASRDRRVLRHPAR